MRNLKKFLALVLAMMMAMSLMLTANALEVRPSGTYDDTSKITPEFVTAVDVLSGMEIFKGREAGGAFDPETPISRAEMAALIYRLKTGDTSDAREGLHTEFGRFDDVKATDWFAGYVGYCANAEIIKGRTDGLFHPYDKVTGYEALAMMLRAIGYDRDHEFTGTGWETQVAAYAQRIGVTDEVKTTIYGSNLFGPARRDVIASMLFATAKKNQVTWSQLTGYTDNLTGVAIGGNPAMNTSGIGTNSLGRVYFGLTETRGVVTANQATNGGTTTSLSQTDYMTSTLSLNNWTTGLEEFGHQFHVWYNVNSSKTYAAYDEVKASKLVLVKDDDGNLASGGVLNDVVTRAGFTVPTSTHMSAAFKPFGTGSSFVNIGNENVDWRGNAIDTTADDRLYLLISNSGSNLDAIVALNVAATAITGVDLITKPNTVSVSYAVNSSDSRSIDVFVDDPANTNGLHSVVTNKDLTGLTGVNRVTINRDALTKGTKATSTLGAYVIANAIGNGAAKTTKDGTEALWDSKKVSNFSLSEVPYKDVTVVGFHTNNYASRTQADLLSNPDYLVISDGTTIEKSMLYYAVAPRSIPQTGASALAQDTYNTSKYRVYMDNDGRYIGAEPVRGEEFLYATYLDYNQKLNTSTFEYFATGFDENGKMVTKSFNAHANGTLINNSYIHYMSGTYGLAMLGVYYHDFDANGQIGTGIGPGNYKGFALNNSGTMFDNTSTSLNPATLGWFDTPTLSGGKDIVIDKNSVAIGAVLFDDSGANNLYLTERTQFYIVSGYGTDSAKATPYKGITAMLNGQSKTTIDITSATPNNVDTEIFYRINTEPYANTLEINAREIETVFIPAEGVTGLSNSIYFAPYNYSYVQDIGTNYQKYIVYQGGERSDAWLTAAPVAGTFYEALQDSGLKTSNGETVYTLINPITPNENTPTPATEVYGAPGSADVSNRGIQYWPTTTNSQVAVLGTYGTSGKMINVANAKIVNLDRSGLPYLQDNDLAGLNQIASNAYQSTTQYAIRVWVQLDAPNGNAATVIYVAGIGDVT